MMKTIALSVSLLCILITNANWLGGKVPIPIYIDTCEEKTNLNDPETGIKIKIDFICD
jgi:hypothetical protein